MPEISVRDKQTGKVSKIQWNKARPPRPDEIRSIVAQNEGAKTPNGFNRSDEDWSVPPPPKNYGTANVYVGGGDRSSSAGSSFGQPTNTTSEYFSRVLDTMQGGDRSFLPPVKGITRAILPEIPREAWGPEENRWKLQPTPGSNIPNIPAISQFGYENFIRPASSGIGLAGEWLGGEVSNAILGPVIRGAGRWLGKGAGVADDVIEGVAERRAGHFGEQAAIGDVAEQRARSIFEQTPQANIPQGKAPSYTPVQRALPPAPTPPRRTFISDEAGVVSDSTRPYTPIEWKPYDPRDVRVASGNVDPVTGDLAPLREQGRYVPRQFDPPPVLRPGEAPVVDISPEIAAAYPKAAGPPKKVGPSLFKTKAAYAAEKEARDRAAQEVLERQAIHASPPQSGIGGGPSRVEAIPQPLARRVGESAADFRARLEAGGELPVSAPPRVGPPDEVPPVMSPDIATRDPFFGRAVGSGQSLGAASQRPGIFARFGETLRNEAGSIPRRGKTTLTPQQAAGKRRTLQTLEQKAAADTVTPKDVKKAGTLGLPESWMKFIPKSLQNEKGSIPLSDIVRKMSEKQKTQAAKEVGPDWVEKLEAWWKKPGNVKAPGSSEPMKRSFGQGLGTKEKPITLDKPTIYTEKGRARIKAETYDALGAPRALMSTIDLSGFRQAAGAMHKKELWQNVGNMFKSAGSEATFKEVQASIASHPKYTRSTKAGLATTDLPKKGGDIAKTEELFMSRMAEKIPGYGKLVRASGRGYVALLNKTRMDLFDNLTEQAVKSGAKVDDKEIAKLVNAMTGRGNLPDTLEKAAPALNAMFFSPRLIASRAHLLNPVNYAKASPMVRKEMVKSIATVAAKWWGMSELLEVGSGGKFKVEKDPRSSDFGKVRIGNTRLDFGSGFQQYIRVAAQLAPLAIGQRGKFKDTDTGKLKEYGEGYRSQTEFDNLTNFAVGKLAPIPSAIATHLRGKTPTGEKPQWLPDMSKITKSPGEELLGKSEVTKRVSPMFAQDMYAMFQEDPKLAAAMAPFLFFGESANIQKKRRPKQSHQ